MIQIFKFLEYLSYDAARPIEDFITVSDSEIFKEYLNFIEKNNKELTYRTFMNFISVTPSTQNREHRGIMMNIFQCFNKNESAYHIDL